MRIEATGLLPVDPQTGLHFSGFTDNCGSAWRCSIHFTLEHNAICDRLAHLNPKWNDQQLYTKAKLINSALMAKIHSVEWTPAILPHPMVKTAMRVNWLGLVGEEAQDASSSSTTRNSWRHRRLEGRSSHRAAFADRGVRRRTHAPLMPDDYEFRSLATGAVLETRSLAEIAGNRAPAIAERITMQDLFYSFGISHPGAITLHNYPRHLQNLVRDDGERLDLAAVDILRDRERGVPRYNQFRRLLRKEPVKSFDELTENPAWRKQIKEVYNGDLEKVDLMTGLFAEPLPEGFGFSETAFRIFVLMASRRLKSDRFLRRLPAGDLLGIRHRAPEEGNDAERPTPPLSAPRAGARWRGECLSPVEADHAES